MLRRLFTVTLACIALVAGGLVAAAPATAAGGVYCNEDNVCYLTITTVSDPAPNPDSNGWTAGAPTCYYETSESGAIQMGYTPDDIRVIDQGNYQLWYVIISCGSDRLYWSNNRQCFVAMVDGVWPARPAGYSQEAGYYSCTMFEGNPGGGGPGLPGGSNFWSETVPPGLKVLTPGAAAAQLIATFQIRGIDIGMAPEVNPAWGHRRSYVGVPIWLWVDNPQPLTWGPYTETATLGGQTITATAQVTSVIWNMGDGASTVCGGTGTPYNAGIGLQPSPTCGYRYATTSDRNANDRYTVTATSQWTVTWTSLAGPTGTINLTATSADQLEINELQTVIVPNDSTTDTSGGTP